MLNAFLNIFRIPDLRNKVFFTLAMLVIYRIGFWVPLVGVDQTQVVEAAKKAADEATGFGRIAQFASIFSGGSLSQSTIFGLGIMPYITASIIFQLLNSVLPGLQELKKEGASGQQKITEWTRYTTVGLCIVQGMMWLSYLRTNGLVQPEFMASKNLMLLYFLSGIAALTAGSIFLMWLGEQIDKYGIGNGVSVILTAGILAQFPDAILWIANNFELSQQSESGKMGVLEVIFLAASFVFVTAGAILITVAQRRIPIQQAKHTRGRKVVGGQRHYLPLRINHAGVMPIIFASSLMIFPSSIFGWLNTRAVQGDSYEWWQGFTGFLADNFSIGQYPYIVIEIALIYFFSYFWTTVQFSPDDMSDQLKRHGSFIPGIRPGPRTADYLETVMERITYVGAGFLAIIAIIPTMVAEWLQIPFFVAAFLGGTGLLIVVSVGLDIIQRIEANLLMRNYAGFLSGDGKGGARIKSRRG